MDDVVSRDKEAFFSSLYDLDDMDTGQAQESRSIPSVKSTGDVPGPPQTCANKPCITTEPVAVERVAQRLSVFTGW